MEPVGHPATAGVAVAVLLAAPGAITLFLGPFRLLGVMPTSRFLLSTPADVLGDWAMVHFATWSAKLFWYLYTLRHPPHDNASTPPTVALGVLAVVVVTSLDESGTDATPAAAGIPLG